MDKKVEIGKSIGYGWETVKKDFWYFVGMAFVISLIEGIFNNNKEEYHSLNFLSVFVTSWLSAGYIKSLLCYFDGKKLPFSEIFTQFKYFWRVLGATLLIGLIVAAGFILLIIPGIYFALTFQFTINLIVDKDLGIIDAMKKSAEMANGVRLPLLGFAFTALGVLILGAIVLGVGIFVAIPVVWLAYIYLYRNLLKVS